MASRKKVRAEVDLGVLVQSVRRLSAEVRTLRNRIDLLQVTQRLDQLAARVAELEARD